MTQIVIPAWYLSLKQHKRSCVQLKTEVWRILITEYKNEEIKEKKLSFPNRQSIF